MLHLYNEGTFVRMFGGVSVSLSGRGEVKPSCNTLGDFYLDGEATATNLPKFVKSVKGKARFESNCDKDSKLIIEVNWDDKKTLEVQMGIQLVMPKWGLFRVDEKYKTGSYARGMSFAMPFGVNGVFRLAYYPPFNGNWMAETLFNEGSVCDAFSDALEVIPFLTYLPHPCGFIRSSPLSFMVSALEQLKFTGATIRFALHGGFNHMIAYVKGLQLFSDIITQDMGFYLKIPAGQRINSATTLKEVDLAVFGEIRMTKNLLPSSIPSFIRVPLALVLGNLLFLKAVAFQWSTYRILEHAAPARAMFPSYLYDLQPGVTLFVVFDLLSAIDALSGDMLDASTSLAKGDDGSEFDVNAKKNTVGDYLSNFAIHVVILGPPDEPEKVEGFCVGHPFRMINPVTNELGILMPGGVTWMSLKVLVCIKWKPKPAFGPVIESVQTVKAYEGDNADRLAGLARERTIVLRNRLEIWIGPTSVTINSLNAAVMKKYSQYFMNPGGGMPKGGIIFPLNIAVGVEIMYSGIGSKMTLFTMEGGFFACSKDIKMIKRSANAELGEGDENLEGGVFQKAFGKDYAEKVRPVGFNEYGEDHFGADPYMNEYASSTMHMTRTSSEQEQDNHSTRQLLYTDTIRYDLQQWKKRQQADASAVMRPPSPPSPPPAPPSPPSPPPPLYKPARMLLQEPKDYECVDDPYSKMPAIIKMGLFNDIAKNKFAMFYVIRRLSM